MVVAETGNILTVPADYLGTRYNSVRYATYHIHNTSGKDFGELVLGLGFKCGAIVNVTTRSEVFGEQVASRKVEGDNSVTVGIPVFNRQDVLVVRIELANCNEIELVWKYVKSHTGVQIEVEYAGAGVTGHPQGSQTSSLQLKKSGPIRRTRRAIATWIHPGD